MNIMSINISVMYKIGKNFIDVDSATSEMIIKIGYKPSYNKKSYTLIAIKYILSIR